MADVANSTSSVPCNSRNPVGSSGSGLSSSLSPPESVRLCGASGLSSHARLVIASDSRNWFLRTSGSGAGGTCFVCGLYVDVVGGSIAASSNMNSGDDLSDE